MDRRRLVIPFFLWFGLFILGPLAVIVCMSFAKRTELGEIETAFVLDAFRQLFDPLYGKIFLKTLVFAGANTLLTLVIAYPLSFYISRLDKTPRTWFLTLVMIPFWTSFLVRILAFMDVIRVSHMGLLYTEMGVILAMAYNYLPFAIMPLFSVMEKIEPSLIEAARDLSASKRQVFFHVVWPLSRPGVVTAFLFVFIPSLGEFLIPELVGGSQHFLLGSFLQNQFFTARNWPLGAATIVILLGMTLIALWAGRKHLDFAMTETKT